MAMFFGRMMSGDQQQQQGTPPGVPPAQGFGQVHHGGGGTTQRSATELLTLLSRVDTCTSLRDKIEAVQELSEQVDRKPLSPGSLASFFQPVHITLLFEILRRHIDSEEIVRGVLDTLGSATKLPASAWQDLSKVSPSTTSSGPDTPEGRRVLVASLLRAVLNQKDAVQLLFDFLKSDTFWIKWSAIQLLSRLHSCSPADIADRMKGDVVQRLPELLRDHSNDGALQNEVIVFLADLTASSASQDFANAFLFEEGFEALFDVINQSGGAKASAYGGNEIVKDCLTVVMNLVSHSKTVQSYFRQMSYVTHLTRILSTPSKDLCEVLDDEGEDGGAVASNIPNSLSIEIMKSCVAIVAALLRGSDSNGEGKVERKKLCDAKMPDALTQFALTTLPALAEDFANEEVEALKALGLLIHGSPAAAKDFLQCVVMQQGGRFSALWITLRMALSDKTPQRQAVASNIIAYALAEAPHDAATRLTHGLVFKAQNSQQGTLPGYILGAFLFTLNKETQTTIYVAAHTLASCVMAGQAIADQTMLTEWEDHNNLFTAFLARAKRLIESRQTDMATFCAVARLILSWLRMSSKAVVVFLSDPQWINFFADWAVANREGVHVSFLCSCIVTLAALMCPHELPAHCRLSRRDATNLVVQKITLERLKNWFETVESTNDWQSSGRATALGQLPTTVLYDASLCKIVTEVLQSSSTLVPSSGTATPSVPSSRSVEDVSAHHHAAHPEKPATATAPQQSATTVPTSAAPSSQLQHEVAALQQQVEQLQRQLAAQKKESEEREAKAHNDHQREIDALQTTVATLEHEKTSQENRINDLELELRQMREQSHHHEELIRQLQGENDELNTTRESQTDLLRSMATNQEQMEAQIRSTMEVKKHEEELQDRVDELANDRDELLILIAELDECCGLLDDENDISTTDVVHSPEHLPHGTPYQHQQQANKHGDH